MSPFAVYLRELRRRRGMNQKGAADLLGYEQSYISALERSAKGPPRRDFITRLIRGLALSEIEQAELAESLRKSKRQISLPCAAPAEEYELLRDLECQLGRLHPAQIELIRQALALPEAFFRTAPRWVGAPSTRAHREATMS